jgi:hypothetical protein
MLAALASLLSPGLPVGGCGCPVPTVIGLVLVMGAVTVCGLEIVCGFSSVAFSAGRGGGDGCPEGRDPKLAGITLDDGGPG